MHRGGLQPRVERRGLWDLVSTERGRGGGGGGGGGGQWGRPARLVGPAGGGGREQGGEHIHTHTC